jgi:hypothetical protein
VRVFYLTFRFVIFLLFVMLVSHAIYAHDFSEEGFGFGAPVGFANPIGLSVNIGGEARAELKAFFNDFASTEKLKNSRLSDIFSGRLDFGVSAASAQALINLNLKPAFDGSSPVEIDEAFVRGFFGPFTIEGGMRKLSWGKADSLGPLDIVNPLDYSDLTKLSNLQEIKIARPMIHAVLSSGSFTKLETVFVPWFQGHKFASSGRWAPAELGMLRSGIEETLAATVYAIQTGTMPDSRKEEFTTALREIGINLENRLNSGAIYPDTGTLEYAQAGIRFSTIMGTQDLGFQYYFGRFPRPVISGFNPGLFFIPTANLSPATDLHPEALIPNIVYNCYHQIGADYATVLAGFNIRAEAGANITGDLDGSDAAVENPSFVWSLGFDRNLLAGIKLNLQGNGKLRFFHEKITANILDCEAGSRLTSTRITGVFSKKYLRDELEVKVTALWGIEDKDLLAMHSLLWSRNDVGFELSMGFFAGEMSGELGQYRDNGFVKALLSYKF